MFVPRSVGKSKKIRQNPAHIPPTTSPHDTTPLVAHDAKGKAKQDTDEEAALLLSLALSDHALWTTPSLRDPNRDGFISLSHLLQTTPYLTSYTNEVALAKALRTHSPDMFETRMIVVSAARPGRNAGGYELRRKDWEAVVERFSHFHRNYWQLRTVYIENIPITYRSTAGVLRLLATFLSDESNHSDPSRIQHVVLPSHYQDPPNATPRCKGFALVTFSDIDAVDRLVREWPWERATTAPTPVADTHADALKAGFRALPKAQWDKLQDEYVVYRDDLLAKMKTTTTERAPTSATTSVRPVPPLTTDKPRLELEPAVSTQTDTLAPDAPYPPNRVLHVRNIHTQTNKTTLRALFSTGLPASAIDYVDFTKGLDTCHLRLSDPQHADTLLASFAKTAQAHAQPLDTSGSAPAPGVKPIALELLQGQKEAAYWEKIPEKVRREAVMKALGGAGGGAEDGGQKRKRRRGA